MFGIALCHPLCDVSGLLHPQGSVDWLISFTAIDWEALLTAVYWLCLSAVSYFPNINQIVTESDKQTESHSHFFFC